MTLNHVTPSRFPTLAEALEYVADLPADCFADRCILVLASEVAQLRGENMMLREQLRANERPRTEGDSESARFNDDGSPHY